MFDGAPAISISGKLSEGDAKRLTNAMRGSTVGPTTLYYAGVTAPVIGAGMALLTKAALDLAGMTPYWKVMLSAIIAAMAGIVWYLIFMRWSYRHRHGRASEMDQESKIKLTDNYISIRRGKVETRIDWAALGEVKFASNYTLIRFEGADPVIVPDSWFGQDSAMREAFRQRLQKG
ncbi:MAG: YcxB family protein [Henriciella sp.]|nr:YcxB family protein [Henriciella sp.]